MLFSFMPFRCSAPDATILRSARQILSRHDISYRLARVNIGRIATSSQYFCRSSGQLGARLLHMRTAEEGLRLPRQEMLFDKPPRHMRPLRSRRRAAAISARPRADCFLCLAARRLAAHGLLFSRHWRWLATDAEPRRRRR